MKNVHRYHLSSKNAFLIGVIYKKKCNRCHLNVVLCIDCQNLLYASFVYNGYAYFPYETNVMINAQNIIIDVCAWKAENYLNENHAI